MKILFILHYPPPVHGSSVVGGFIKESRLINESFDCRYVNLGTSASVEEIGKNPAGKLLRYFRLIWQVKKALLFFRPDICYLTISSKGTGFYKDALIVLLVRLFGVRRLYHFHNKGVSTRQDHFFDNLLYRLVFSRADVIVLSKHLYPDVQKYVSEDRVHYCPNGLPEIKDKRQKSQDKSSEVLQSGERGLESMRRHDDYAIGRNIAKSSSHTFAPSHPHPFAPSGASQLLFLSHLIRSKGVLVLIDTCALLKERGVEFHCTIAGGNAELTKTEVESVVAEKGLSPFITVAGPKHGEDKAELMRSADIFIHPTFNDGLPLVLLEAMQFSLPIIATPEGAIPDVVEDGVTGFLVPQRNARALAEKLEVLIQNSDLRLKMGSAGRAKYKAQFTLERFENRLTEILNELS